MQKYNIILLHVLCVLISTIYAHNNIIRNINNNNKDANILKIVIIIIIIV